MTRKIDKCREVGLQSRKPAQPLGSATPVEKTVGNTCSKAGHDKGQRGFRLNAGLTIKINKALEGEGQKIVNIGTGLTRRGYTSVLNECYGLTDGKSCSVLITDRQRSKRGSTRGPPTNYLRYLPLRCTHAGSRGLLLPHEHIMPRDIVNDSSPDTAESLLNHSRRVPNLCFG